MDNARRSDVSISNWMGTQFLLLIPAVNLILLVVWSITGAHRSKRNYCIAALLWMVIFCILAVLAFVFFGPQMVDWANNLKQSIEALP